MEEYTVLSASNTEDAVRIFREHGGKIDLLLTDVVIPQVGGAELAEILSEIDPELQVLFMSGYTDDAISHQGVLKSGIAFLEKPFLPDMLLERVGDILEGA